MSFKAEVITAGSTDWAGNALVFPTAAEAAAYAQDLFSRWTAVQEWRVVPTDTPANYNYVNGEGVRIAARQEGH